MPRSLRRADTAEREDETEHDGERGERIPLQRVRVVLLHARVGPLPLAHETVRRLGVLLDVVRNERKAGLGLIRLDIERLPHALALLRPDLKEAGEMRSHDALEGDGPRGRANLRQALAPRRRWSPAAVDENELVAAGHAQRHDYL